MCLFVGCGACGWLGGPVWSSTARVASRSRSTGPAGGVSGGWTIQKVYDLPMYDQLPGVPRRRALLEALQRARRLRVLLLGNQ